MSYTAPVKDMLFVMKELAALEDIAKLPGFEDANLDTAQAVLEESAQTVRRGAGAVERRRRSQSE